jgi:AAHS family 4-hydroxybenzoate transporter-like MFS transporter
MNPKQRIDIAQILNEQRFSGFLIGVIVFSMILMFLDGYDTQVIAFAAPRIAQAWHIPQSSFGTVFAMGPVGMLIGGIGFGFLADIKGRKPIIILSTLCFGLPIMAAPFCTTISQLVIMRLISGFGVGGLFSLAIVFALEFAPRRYRSTMVVIANVGYSTGISFGGVLAATLIPHFGWPVVFWFGGIAAVAACPVFGLWLPESIRFLAVMKRRPAEIARILRILKPGIAIAPDAEFFASDDERLLGKGRPSIFMLTQMFRGRLAWMTPLLWVCYVCSSATTFFLSLWGPTLLEQLGVSPGRAAIGVTFYSIAGLVAALILGRVIDRFGAIVITLMPLIACPLVASLGILPLSEGMYMVWMGLVGFFVVGGHAALHSISGIFYPSAYRANGAGWALSISRLGTIAGPFAGGILLAAHVPLKEVFLIAAMPPVVFGAGVCILGLFHRRVLQDEAVLDAARVALGAIAQPGPQAPVIA